MSSIAINFCRHRQQAAFHSTASVRYWLSTYRYLTALQNNRIKTNSNFCDAQNYVHAKAYIATVQNLDSAQLQVSHF